MMPKPSEEKVSSAYHRLHERVQRWIWEKGWTELRDVQEEAINTILDGGSDVIIAAPTAGGKTEAAFLPITSKLIGDEHPGFDVLYISPLKALINDQDIRLLDLCETLDIPVHKWHGDVAQSCKAKALKAPKGILLITPESLEAQFILRGSGLPSLFTNLSWVVIDELHAFIGSERGRQLQSLLHRLEMALRRQVPRIGLSATLGDMGIAEEFLRWEATLPCRTIISSSDSADLRLAVRGFERRMPEIKTIRNGFAEPDNAIGNEESSKDSGDIFEIARELLKTLKGTTNLVFANRRQDVESFSAVLREMCEDAGLPNEFYPHHGSLSKEAREHVEILLKDSCKPATAIATTTLELGIDIGQVHSIAQIGAPPSVASLRQRIGRSGRRGKSAILRAYVQEEEIKPSSALSTQLRTHLFHTVSMIELLLKRWCEPPSKGKLHLSTLIQQTLSIIAQFGGAHALDMWRILCKSGPFHEVNSNVYQDLLKSLAGYELIKQTDSGALVLDNNGERLVNHYDFYTAFTTPEEYRIVCDQKNLGSLPIDSPILKGDFIIFGGRRWEVLEVEAAKKVILVKRAKGGRPPKFGGEAGIVHDRIRQEMFEIYCSDRVPVYLDKRAQKFMEEGRDAFRRYGLAERQILRLPTETYIFPWTGDRKLHTILCLLRAFGLAVEKEGVAIHIKDNSGKSVGRVVEEIVEAGPADAYVLARTVLNKIREKHDRFLSEDLLCLEEASRSFDTTGAWELLASFDDFVRQVP